MKVPQAPSMTPTVRVQKKKVKIQLVKNVAVISTADEGEIWSKSVFIDYKFRIR